MLRKVILASPVILTTSVILPYGSYICLRQVILLTTLAVVVGRTTHFACSVGSYKSTHFFEDGTRGAAATRKGAPSTRICTQSLVRSVFFCTKATSGIMRRRRFMCARRKERSDGIAIATKSIASSCPARRALPNGRRGKHVRKGDIFLTCSHYACKKKALF